MLVLNKLAKYVPRLYVCSTSNNLGHKTKVNFRGLTCYINNLRVIEINKYKNEMLITIRPITINICGHLRSTYYNGYDVHYTYDGLCLGLSIKLYVSGYNKIVSSTIERKKRYKKLIWKNNHIFDNSEFGD